MKFKSINSFFITIVFLILAIIKPKNQILFNSNIYIDSSVLRIDTLTLMDSTRRRIIPIAIYNKYEPNDLKNSFHKNIRKKLVLLNPGYGGTNTDYSYIANKLVEYNYLVVTIQHDLSTDGSLPTSGDIYKARKVFWDTGVKSIFYVTDYLRKKYQNLDYKNIILIGHSNGGDISILIANEYPNFAKTVITLDNRRVSFPRSDKPKIFSIRSSDQLADPNVLPSIEEQKKYRIKIVKVNTKHNDMGGMGTEAQKQEINNYILDFLNSN
jgi:pimeloyl-ACP methyl ester carboxylesterase